MLRWISIWGGLLIMMGHHDPLRRVVLLLPSGRSSCRTSSATPESHPRSLCCDESESSAYPLAARLEGVPRTPANERYDKTMRLGSSRFNRRPRGPCTAFKAWCLTSTVLVIPDLLVRLGFFYWGHTCCRWTRLCGPS